MIISAEKLIEKYPEYVNHDIYDLKDKLDAIELLIRKYTNNNFQNRYIRFAGKSDRDRIFGHHSFIRVGDTIQISESEVNDGLYVVEEVGLDFIRLDREVFNVNHNLVTMIAYPKDVIQGTLNLMKYDLEMRDKVGIKSESISRHSVTYYDMNDGNQTMGYPKSLLGFLKPYMKARF